jgi:NADH:ubiquinone oxidoreductase subunit E
MPNSISQCMCKKETEDEKYEKIARIIDEYKDKEGSLIQVLHMAQGIYGYLPVESWFIPFCRVLVYIFL